jgi:hypothetical protein
MGVDAVRPTPAQGLLAGTRDVPAPDAARDVLRLCQLVEEILSAAGRQAPAPEAGKKVA